MACIYNENKLYKISSCSSRDIIKFDFLKKSLRQVSPTHFLYDLSRKIFVMLYSINYFIVCLSLLIEVLDDMCIVIICFHVSGVEIREICITA